MNSLTLGVSLKMYFGYRQTLDWCEAIAGQLEQHAAVRSGRVRVFIVPSFPMLAPVLERFAGRAQVGAQNLCWEDRGAFTGEVSPAVLREMGCHVVEIGHAERIRHFAETPAQIAAKTAAAWRNGLTPVLCVGEQDQGSVEQAIGVCTEQLHSALAVARAAGLSGALILAYEPQWAIGAAQPAAADFIGAVCAGLRAQVRGNGLADARVIYGGSAGPGLLAQLGTRVDGLFLGRFAHDPAAFARILDEAAAVVAHASEEHRQWQSA
jgi:triosephosphate isomerase